jgi:UDP-hydrolysing UDP-N-acetyl-D-glucosamine 2-epimerase
MKICVFVGSRANYGRLYALLEAIDSDQELELQIIATYFIPYDECLAQRVVFKIDSLLYYDTPNNSVQNSSMLASHVSNFFENRGKPDLAVVHGDRFENLGFAVACSYNNIPLLHTEGGEESGNIDNKIRYAISALADIHCVTTEESKMRLAYKEDVFNVGSVALDLVREQKNAILSSSNVYSEPYILAMYNPCSEDTFTEFIEAVLELNKRFRVVWINPNIDPGYRDILKQVHKQGIEFIKNLSPQFFLHWLNGCLCLVGNTSAGIKEGAMLGVPYVMVGNRQYNREHDNNIVHVVCEKQHIVDKCVFTILHDEQRNKVRWKDETIF